jgi:hypothetical protein
MASIASITAALILDVSKFKGQVQGAERELLKMNRSMQSIGVNLSAALTLPIAAFAATATKTAAEFGFIQAKIAGLSGSSSVIEGLSNSARQLGRDTIFTAAEISNLQLELVKLGLREKEIKAVQDQAVRFAQALDIDVAKAGATVVELLNKMPNSFSEFSSKTEAAQYATDAFAYAVASSALDVEGLTSSLNYVGAEADAMGFSFEQTVGMLAVLANAGYKGSRAGTQLRRILVEVAAASDDSGQSMRDFINSNGSFSDVLQEVGIRAAGMGVALQGQQKFIDNFALGMENSEGYLQNVSNVIEDSLYYSLKRTQSAFEELQISFATAVEPAIRSLLDALTFLMNGFSAIPGPIKVVMAIVASLLAVIGPLLASIASYNILMTQAAIVSARFAASMRLIMSSLGWVGIVGVATGVLAAFITNTDDATASFEEFKKSLKDITVPDEAISSLQTKIAELKTQISDIEKKEANVGSEKDPIFGLIPLSVYGSTYNRRRSLVQDRIALDMQLKELERMLEVQKEFKRGADMAAGTLAAINADRDLEDKMGGKTLEQILKRYNKVKESIKQLQDQAKRGGNAIQAFKDIEVANEELDELKKILEALGYSFDKTKTDLSDTAKELTDWEKAIVAAKEAMAQAKAEFEVTGDNISKLEAYAAAQQQLAVAAALFGKTETKEGIDALAKFIEYTSQSNAAIKARELAEAYKQINGSFDETMRQLDFQRSLGGLTDIDYAQAQISALKELSEQMYALGNVEYATEYYNRALALEEFLKSTQRLLDENTVRSQELLSFVQSIGNAVGNIFRDLTSGTKSFAEVLKRNFIDALTAIIGKLIAIAAMWILINILSGGKYAASGIGKTAGNLKASYGTFSNFATSQFGLGSFTKSTPVTVDGSISGHTIYLSNKRALNSYDRTYGG